MALVEVLIDFNVAASERFAIEEVYSRERNMFVLNQFFDRHYDRDAYSFVRN
jgi:hypothetical protein